MTLRTRGNCNAHDISLCSVDWSEVCTVRTPSCVLWTAPTKVDMTVAAVEKRKRARHTISIERENKGKVEVIGDLLP